VKLVVGLGNPGKEYANTRHNLGFFFVDLLKKEITASGVTFFKNSSFINEAGKEVKKTISWHKITLEDVLVIHDDFDLELGQFRVQSNRSSAGHKGVQSLINEIGSQGFFRLRVGIGHPPAEVEANDYVLEHFSPQEQKILDSIYPRILITVKDWLLKEEK